MKSIWWPVLGALGLVVGLPATASAACLIIWGGLGIYAWDSSCDDPLIQKYVSGGICFTMGALATAPNSGSVEIAKGQAWLVLKGQKMPLHTLEGRILTSAHAGTDPKAVDAAWHAAMDKARTSPASRDAVAALAKGSGIPVKEVSAR